MPSTGPHFTYAIFGRDSLETAEDVLETHPHLVQRHYSQPLARLQGIKIDLLSEEEPGKIHHEYRCATFGGEAVPEYSLSVLHDLQKIWGDQNTDHMVYYGSHDATLLYIRLIGRYVGRYGRTILDETFTGADDRHPYHRRKYASGVRLDSRQNRKLGVQTIHLQTPQPQRHRQPRLEGSARPTSISTAMCRTSTKALLLWNCKATPTMLCSPVAIWVWVMMRHVASGSSSSQIFKLATLDITLDGRGTLFCPRTGCRRTRPTATNATLTSSAGGCSIASCGTIYPADHSSAVHRGSCPGDV